MVTVRQARQIITAGDAHAVRAGLDFSPQPPVAPGWREDAKQHAGPPKEQGQQPDPAAALDNAAYEKHNPSGEIGNRSRSQPPKPGPEHFRHPFRPRVGQQPRRRNHAKRIRHGGSTIPPSAHPDGRPLWLGRRRRSDRAVVVRGGCAVPPPTCVGGSEQILGIGSHPVKLPGTCGTCR